MKKLKRINKGLISISVWCLRLIFVLTIWLVTIKFADLGFVIELGEKVITITNQMLVEEAFWSVIALIVTMLACLVFERIVYGVMTFKRRKRRMA